MELNYACNIEDMKKIGLKHIFYPHDACYILQNDHILIAGSKKENIVNFEEIKKNNIPFISENMNSGALIIFPEDISIGVYILKENNLGEQVLNAVQQYLYKKDIITKRDSNDLMAYSPTHDDWFKIASYASSKFGLYLVYVIHISINMDEDLVQKICIKKTTKRPGGLLPLFNINNSELYEIIMPILEQQIK